MSGETDLQKLLKEMKPSCQEGAYVFCVVTTLDNIDLKSAVMTFVEEEGITLILKKETADRLGLSYIAVMSWITLTVHSSLEAVGLTAAFSKALSEQGISCNVVAAFYHDHIFVAQKDAVAAMHILQQFSA
ncbi:ACT domain-containing protein [Chitinophaga arvensicola]|uniref:Uncharacterized protein n=1 Tax=Chitinophaga arvensicola TaxID=29529 RepID=A0A1I0S711_9BACT|nr:ACT domain-containing protein [Chitinophaga arvensicola]SEW51463.1 hypothetical protein SAMN04488122_4249 [Chitinophaga arvensicola]